MIIMIIIIIISFPFEDELLFSFSEIVPFFLEIQDVFI